MIGQYTIKRWSKLLNRRTNLATWSKLDPSVEWHNWILTRVSICLLPGAEYTVYFANSKWENLLMYKDHFSPCCVCPDMRRKFLYLCSWNHAIDQAVWLTGRDDNYYMKSRKEILYKRLLSRIWWATRGESRCRQVVYHVKCLKYA